MLFRSALESLKWLLPKKPLRAERGEGCCGVESVVSLSTKETTYGAREDQMLRLSEASVLGPIARLTKTHLVQLRNPLLRRLPPSKEHDSIPFLPHSLRITKLVDEVHDSSREFLPAFLRVRAGVVCAHGERGVKEEDTGLGVGNEVTVRG